MHREDETDGAPPRIRVDLESGSVQLRKYDSPE
ncbi:DUF6191 domain-containing protein [Prescottella defluvii]|nr:DUF6191 domain-containing protein [Prescottella defluvii]